MTMKNLRMGLFTVSIMVVILPMQVRSQQCTFCPTSVNNGSSSSALGYGNSALGGSSTVIGFRSESNAQGSIAIGKDLVVPSQFPYNIVIGSGYNENNKLINSFGPSLIVGFGSNIHTFIVYTAPSNGKTGKVGIGSVTSPQAKLHIKADTDEPATLKLEATGTLGDNIFSRILFTPNHIIQAADNQNFTFTTQSTRHFVFQNGNVGIGTANPQRKLHVAGDIEFSGNLYKNGLLYSGSNWTLNEGDIYRLNGKVGIGISKPEAKLEVHGTLSLGYNVHVPQDQNNMIVEGKVGIGTFAPTEKLEVFGKTRTSQLQIIDGLYPGYLLLSDELGNALWTDPESITNIGPWTRQGDFVFVADSRKVGIGTSQPQQALHVVGNMLLGNNGNIIGNRTSWQPLKIFAGDDENQAHISLHGNHTEAGSIKLYSRGTEGQIEFHNQSMKVMSIRADNSVVIGNPDNSCLVFINGELTANQVRVNTGFWWDKVFSPNYPLMPLAELGNFIAKNRHLPEIPNETEVLDKGVELGEMNGLLLKKIEELTLYLLEQDRKINSLQTELQQIKKAGNNN
jgi:hypothetical protein